MDLIRDAAGQLKPGFFYCEKQSCTMLETACLARFKNTLSNGPPQPGMIQPGRYDYRCQNCEQGLALMAKDEEGKMSKKESNIKPPDVSNKPSPPPAPPLKKSATKAVPASIVKICQDPECVFEGTPQPIENFGGHYRTKDGLQKYCRTCMGRRMSAKKCTITEPTMPDKTILIDMTDYPPGLRCHRTGGKR